MGFNLAFKGLIILENYISCYRSVYKENLKGKEYLETKVLMES